VQLDTIKVLLPTNEQNNCFKRILKFTLKIILNLCYIKIYITFLNYIILKFTLKIGLKLYYITFTLKIVLKLYYIKIYIKNVFKIMLY
jgi:hypothetical protein